MEKIKSMEFNFSVDFSVQHQKNNSNGPTKNKKQHLYAVLLYLILDLFVNYLCSWCTCTEM